jgi:ABC-type multidrug transport system ATPase subunit
MTSQPYASNAINTPSGAVGINILLQQVGKRFNRDWIFRKLDYHFEAGKAYAITGPNGSGKSTLLQVIAGSTNASEGQVNLQTSDSLITTEAIYQHVSIAAPYLEVIEEMTAQEFLQFHAAFKNLTHSINEILSIIGLDKAANKQIRYYSSGMKQRIKLAQAIFVNTPILLLDEPCTNLDKTGYDLYHQLIATYCSNKLIVVSSNDENEMDFCGERLSIMDYKK